MTGFTAAMQVRSITESLVVSLTTGSGITLGGVAGTITLTISATTTASLDAGNYVYDLFLTSSGGVVTRLLAGGFRVEERVTQ